MGQVAERDRGLVNAVTAQQLKDILYHRAAEYPRHRLRYGAGERAQAAALTARHDNCFHRLIPFPLVIRNIMSKFRIE